MSDVIISPNMSLLVPIVGIDPGPDWANNLNASLSIIDQHDHSAGQGVPINPGGININTNLPMNGNSLTSIGTLNFTPYLASLPGAAPNLGAVYVAGNELYYNDEAGNVVEITHNGSVNAGAGSITGLPSGTASASYNAGSQTFIFQSATNTPANIDGGSFIVRDVSANSHGISINAPIGLVADYNLNLPAGLPVSTKILTVDNSGNVGDVYDVDNMTIQVSSNLIGVIPGSITNVQIAPSTILRSNIAPVGQQVSASCGSFSTASTAYFGVTNLSVTITSFGNPVYVGVMSDGSGPGSGWSVSTTGTNCQGFAALFRGVTNVAQYAVDAPNGGFTSTTLPSLMLLDVVAAGTYTYTVQVKINSTTGSNVLAVSNYVLFAYEIG